MGRKFSGEPEVFFWEVFIYLFYNTIADNNLTILITQSVTFFKYKILDTEWFLRISLLVEFYN